MWFWLRTHGSEKEEKDWNTLFWFVTLWYPPSEPRLWSLQKHSLWSLMNRTESWGSDSSPSLDPDEDSQVGHGLRKNRFNLNSESCQVALPRCVKRKRAEEALCFGKSICSLCFVLYYENLLAITFSFQIDRLQRKRKLHRRPSQNKQVVLQVNRIEVSQWWYCFTARQVEAMNSEEASFCLTLIWKMVLL